MASTMASPDNSEVLAVHLWVRRSGEAGGATAYAEWLSAWSNFVSQCQQRALMNAAVDNFANWLRDSSLLCLNHLHLYYYLVIIAG